MVQDSISPPDRWKKSQTRLLRNPIRTGGEGHPWTPLVDHLQPNYQLDLWEGNAKREHPPLLAY